MWGQLPSLAMTLRRSMVSAFPTTSSRTIGLYFSTLAESQTKVHEMENATDQGSSYGISTALGAAGFVVAVAMKRTRYLGGFVCGPGLTTLPLPCRLWLAHRLASALSCTQVRRIGSCSMPHLKHPTSSQTLQVFFLKCSRRAESAENTPRTSTGLPKHI